jgi:hypothetical protein
MTVLVPFAAGVPLIWPLLLLMVRFAGNPVAEYVRAPTPPVVWTLAEYWVPTLPFGSDVVVIVSGPTTVTVASTSEMFVPLA